MVLAFHNHSKARNFALSGRTNRGPHSQVKNYRDPLAQEVIITTPAHFTSILAIISSTKMKLQT